MEAHIEQGAHDSAMSLVVAQNAHESQQRTGGNHPARVGGRHSNGVSHSQA
ncbi:hypothetical protein RRH01S_32_00070 [Rhizobium rhizogenes NBRC 13257]|uniref:Uncharacterized protein n=1 Tax=Rhizobium rhizogenes NBRC 13257 TaxID=1220581 RepID=A0AA87U7U0_RHIRH|nr:hypothetical protein RRH01S_32_00070 [Rhizobium rhizogenes NBRC 13257]